MRVTLSHISAAYQWLMTPMDGRELDKLARRGSLGAVPTAADDLSWLDFEKYRVEGLEFEFLTTDHNSCPRPDLFHHHVSSRDFPQGAFVVLDDDVQIVSPELSFWQMDKVLPFGELIKYGDALCSRRSYSRDADGKLIEREVPLTTIAKLERFLRAMGKSAVRSNAYKALRYIVEGSESPMESCSTVLLCLKRQYGGFGFIRPVMGHVVNLDDDAKKLTDTDTCRCDMYWSHAHYDLEYDSEQEHSGYHSSEHDSLRRTAIKHMGIRVGELRRVQVVDRDLFVTAARFLAKDLGIRIYKRSPELEFKYWVAYCDLRKQLFWWERRDAGEDPSPLRVADLSW